MAKRYEHGVLTNSETRAAHNCSWNFFGMPSVQSDQIDGHAALKWIDARIVELGQAGWELVSHEIEDSGDRTDTYWRKDERYYFKRVVDENRSAELWDTI